MIKKMTYLLFAWRKNPDELLHRILNGNNYEKFGYLRHRFSEFTLFFLRLGLRPLTYRCMKRVYFTYNYQPMGIGYFTSALKNKDSVTKIFEFSTKFTHKQISKLENHLITVIQIAEKYLGSFVVNTKVRVINHPYLNKPCVALEQPYIEGIPLHGKNYAKQLNKAQRTQLKKLLDLNMIMQKETGYTADLNGHNLFVVGDKLYLVDTILSGKVVAERRRTTVKIPNREAKNLEQEYIN